MEELHLRLVVELTALSDDLLAQLSAADEVRGLSDFCAHVLDTYFMLPNPMYGSWQ